MVKKLVSRSEFARMAGTSPANVTKLCNGTLKGAAEGKMVDTAHPSARAYLDKRNGKKTSAPPKSEKKRTARGREAAQQKRRSVEVKENSAYEVPENIAPFMDYSIRDILSMYGTQPAFEAWLKSAKTLEDLREKQLKNAQFEKQVIDRELVSSHVFALIDTTYSRLLGDTSKTLAQRISAAVRSNESPENIEKLIVKIISDQLKQTKNNALKVLKNA